VLLRLFNEVCEELEALLLRELNKDFKEISRKLAAVGPCVEQLYTIIGMRVPLIR
jgi:hypothetical protein